MTTMGKRSGIAVLRVRGIAGQPGKALLSWGATSIPCAIGPAGVHARKREGDGATPIGSFRLLHAFYRADRGSRPLARLPLRPVRRSDGWCDDPASRCYNRPVRLPFAAGHERMWRDDNLYDLVVILGHNHTPRVRGFGSAIFFHVMRPDGAPTAGCVAIPAAAMRRLLPRLSARTIMRIG